MPTISFKYRKIVIFFLILIIIISIYFSINWIGKLLSPIHYEDYIIKYSNEYDIDPLLVTSIIKVESKYYNHAESSKGAKGLMQITSITGNWAAEEIGIEEYSDELLYDPEVNILIGCWYISKLKKQFNNDLKLVIAAYNGGSGNVTKWLNNKEYSKDGENLMNIPFEETEQYVSKVLRNYKIYKKLYK